MALSDILQSNHNMEIKKQGLSEQRLQDNLESLRKLISFYR